MIDIILKLINKLIEKFPRRKIDIDIVLVHRMLTTPLSKKFLNKPAISEKDATGEMSICPQQGRNVKRSLLMEELELQAQIVDAK